MQNEISYTIEEVAKLLKIGVSTFRRMIKNNEAPIYYMIGKRVRFTHERVIEWIEQNEVQLY